jgi:hypothetical protein
MKEYINPLKDNIQYVKEIYMGARGPTMMNVVSINVQMDSVEYTI